MSRIRLLLVIGLALGVLCAACGKSDPPAPSTAPASTTSIAGPPSTLSANVKPEIRAFCTKYADVVRLLKVAGAKPTEAAAFAPVKAKYVEALAIAPPDMKADMQVVSGKVASMSTAEDAIKMAGPAKDASDRVQVWVTTNCNYVPSELPDGAVQG